MQLACIQGTRMPDSFIIVIPAYAGIQGYQQDRTGIRRDDE
jgi:hypothetical protein